MNEYSIKYYVAVRDLKSKTLSCLNITSLESIQEKPFGNGTHFIK